MSHRIEQDEVMACVAELELCAPSTGGDAAGADDARQRVILAVDDDATVRWSVVLQLKALGYQVLEADNGHAALAIIESGERIDLLLTDIVMPGGLNGKELATRARLKRPHLKVLFTSGFPGAVALDHSDVLLSKPYRRDDLAKAVRDTLNAGAA